MNRNWQTNPPRTFDAAVQIAKELRVAVDSSEAALMKYLRWLEGHPELWQKAADATFDSFLKTAHICQPDRYRDATKAFDDLTVPVVDTIGLHAAIVTSRVPADKRAAAVAKMMACRTVNGVPPSKQDAELVLANAALLPPVEVSKAEKTLGRVSELEKASVELRQRLAEAEARAVAAEELAKAYADQLRAAGLAPKAPGKNGDGQRRRPDRRPEA